jgi:hypothetical protein
MKVYILVEELDNGRLSVDRVIRGVYSDGTFAELKGSANYQYYEVEEWEVSEDSLRESEVFSI